MFPARCKSFAAYLIVAIHFLALACVVYFDNYWSNRRRGPAAATTISAGLLVCLGADLALLAFWLMLSSTGVAARVIATVFSTLCWIGIYDPRICGTLRNWRYYGGSGWQYHFYSRCAATGGLALMVISIMACALWAVRRRGAKLRQLKADELHREPGNRQFQVSHLLIFVAVLSLVLAYSINSRQWLSPRISLRWDFAGYAPIESAETVLYSAFTLSTVSLALAWATLGYGRPWLKLIMALTAAGFLGFAWAYSFTSAQHEKFLLGNVLFSMIVALLQAIVISVALLSVRFRGYRLTKSSA
jgi:hypothetical protein